MTEVRKREGKVQKGKGVKKPRAHGVERIICLNTEITKLFTRALRKIDSEPGTKNIKEVRRRERKEMTVARRGCTRV